MTRPDSDISKGGRCSGRTRTEGEHREKNGLLERVARTRRARASATVLCWLSPHPQEGTDGRRSSLCLSSDFLLRHMLNLPQSSPWRSAESRWKHAFSLCIFLFAKGPSCYQKSLRTLEEKNSLASFALACQADGEVDGSIHQEMMNRWADDR